MKQMEPPLCRCCESRHWAREGCYGMLIKMDTPREGRRVLKGSTPKASGAKPTRTASTERANPPTPAKAPAEQATGDKPAGGAAKPRRKKKAKKRAKKKAVA